MINGIILVDKPRGISSNAVVNIVKKVVGADKAGHLGTLDVEGQGLLPVTLGKGTKLFDYFLNKDKMYEATFKFGVETDTLDLEGKIVHEDDKIITREQIERVVPSFIGTFDQIPPQYSAKKVHGQKAYDLARKGIEVQLKPKRIEIYDLKLLEQTEPNSFKFYIHCSSGTFIRSLARDMSRALSTYATMSYIQRTRCGVFILANAHSLESIKSGNYSVVPLDTVFDYQPLKVDDDLAAKLLNGQTMPADYPSGTYKLYNGQAFLGLAEVKQNKIKISLRLI